MEGLDEKSPDEQPEGEQGAPQSEQPCRSHPCPVVGLGASAGGLEAFQGFLSSMPSDSGMVFVLVQHLDPRHETLMPELLARHTGMPLQLVTEDTPAERNHVYVVPPNAMVTIDDCVLKVTRASRSRGRRSPIDGFFRSLAEDQGIDAVGILLSGTGTDGALGLKALKEQGGLVLVQSPGTARHDSMPRAAILTGAVDHVLAVEEMPARLLDHDAELRRQRQGKSADSVRGEVAGELRKICTILRRKTGHDFSHYKQSTLVRRIRRRMQELRAETAADYVERLGQDPKEVDQLFHDLLIGVTHFFRDPEAFDLLARKVIPKIFETRGREGQVRVWVAGCASGEEAYSLAILLREHMDTMEEPPHAQVFATDIDTQALEFARQALYPDTVAEQIPPGRLARFFVRHGNMVQVSKEIREMCLFSTHNLITDPPFSRLDLLSCRNLLIYLEPELQKRLIPLCHYALRPGGFLFLGPSENVASHPELFRTVEKKHRIFQSKETVLRPPISFPLTERSRALAARQAGDEASRLTADREQALPRVFERILMDSYAPACVVVHERGEIVYFSPRTGKYLESPPGAPTLNVMDMARKGLRLDLRTALHRAVTSRSPVVHENVLVETDGPPQRINLTVRPLPELGEDPGLFMIVFQEVVQSGDATAETAPGGAPGGETAASDYGAEAVEIIRRLEKELRATKDHLQATLEELESSNEELVSSNEELLSMNEELQSANEELQTSKEELQSVNEELETINAELKKKLEELDRANSDLQNLFQSTQIATVFVDRDLRIQKFTVAATEVFRLIETDVGRRIDDIAPRFSGGELMADIRHVLRTLSARELQVRLLDEPVWYIARILPYRTVDNMIDGVVLTFVDITGVKRAEEHRARLASIVESSQDAIFGKTLEGVITTWNQGAERMYGYTEREAVGRPVTFLLPPGHEGELGPILEKLRRGERISPFETVRIRKNGALMQVLLTISPVRDTAGQVVEASVIARDITEQKRAEQALREAAQRKDEFLAMLGHELRNPLAPIRNCLHVLSRPQATAEHVDKAKATIERQVSHLTRLVDDLLDISRISQGKVLLRRQRLDLVDLVRTAVEDQRGSVEAAGLAASLDLPPRPLWVAGDPTRLAQILGNVLHNAVKFTERGGAIDVSLREAPEGGAARIAVRDTGIGIEPELLARLFEPFHQAETGLDRARGGLGLGLALVKGLVDLHGGRVEAVSEGAGRGVEIRIELPLEAQREEAPPPAAAAPGVRRSRRCLIIEDNADAAESLGLLLELSGHEVTLAHDGVAGVEKARTLRPEVVLCDIGLPGKLDGYGVARALRQHFPNGDLHLIALTGYGQEEDQRRAREAGFDLHLTKPADPEKLQRLLAEL